MMYVSPKTAWVTAVIAVISSLFSVQAFHSGAGLVEHRNIAMPDGVYFGLSQAAVRPSPITQGISRMRVLRRVRRLAGPYAAKVLSAAHLAHVKPTLVAAVLHVENGGDFIGANHRVSIAGAIGPMQLMPSTAWDWLKVNPWSVAQNIDGGARYLAQMIHQFSSLRLALMAYNAGPGAIAAGYRPLRAAVYARHVLRLYAPKIVHQADART